MLRTGRGGAGNFHERKDAEHVVNNQDEDAKKAPPGRTHPTPTLQDHTLSGRGGAGNVVTCETGSDMAVDAASRELSQSVMAQLGRNGERSGSAGRGGAGNLWVRQTTEDDMEQARAEDAAKRRAIEEKVQCDVESSLPRPIKAFTRSPQR